MKGVRPLTKRTGRYFRDINSLAQWLVPSENSVSLVLSRERDEATRKQYDRASQMVDGDILLSFVKGVAAWTGVSLVQTNKAKGHTRPLNPVETTDPWSTYFGYALDVVPLFQLLNPEQCFLTSNAALGLSYQGRGIYTRMQQVEDCRLIEAKVEEASKQSPRSVRDSADPITVRLLDAFCHQWQQSLERDPYLTEIAVSLSGRKCSLCGTTAHEWVARVSSAQPDQDYRNVFDDPEYRFTFLEGHHELPRAHGGDARLENLLALCPNCHHVVGRNLEALQKDRERN